MDESAIVDGVEDYNFFVLFSIDLREIERPQKRLEYFGNFWGVYCLYLIKIRQKERGLQVLHSARGWSARLILIQAFRKC